MIFLKLIVFIFLYELLLIVSADEVEAEKTEPEGKYYDLTKAKELFEEFIKTYNKIYVNVKEYNYRFEVFVETLDRINKLNNGSDGEEYGITEFADMTIDEIVHEHTGLDVDHLNTTEGLKSSQRLRSSIGRLKQKPPKQWDWRAKGLVTPVKDQANCQSCWAFSAIAIMEGQYAKKYGKLISLSEQQLLDCYKKNCQQGDFPHSALRYAEKMGGLMSYEDYPYKAKVGRCHFKLAKVKAKVKKGTSNMYLLRNEEELKNLVYAYGPISTGIVVTPAFTNYKKGIATAKKLGCAPHARINHAVTVVGYGEENGTPYWIIKNSAGSRWGEKGYLRLVRGVNACSILQYVAASEVV